MTAQVMLGVVRKSFQVKYTFMDDTHAGSLFSGVLVENVL